MPAIARASLTRASATASVELDCVAAMIKPLRSLSSNTVHQVPRSVPSAGRASFHAPSTPGSASRYCAGTSVLIVSGGLLMEHPASSAAASVAIPIRVVDFLICMTIPLLLVAGRDGCRQLRRTLDGGLGRLAAGDERAQQRVENRGEEEAEAGHADHP